MHTSTINAIITLEIILTCYNYICNADSNACGTKREPSPHPVPLTPRKTASINDSPIHHWVKNLASPPLSIGTVIALQAQFHTMGMNHYQNAHVCTSEACNNSNMEYDHTTLFQL